MIFSPLLLSPQLEKPTSLFEEGLREMTNHHKGIENISYNLFSPSYILPQGSMLLQIKLIWADSIRPFLV